ncbi:MAG: transcriptional regulator [Desulfobacterales bacterium]|nr:MAG: transcriptional regulator [Desulfobacterales bacterium]
MKSDKIRTLLGKCSLFAELPDEQVALVADLTIEKNYRKGASIFFEGEEADGFYVVAEGKVKVFKISPLGKEHILHIFGAGEPIGEVAVFHERPFPASAAALSKSSMLYFRRKDFVRLIKENPSISLNMLGVMSRRLRQFTVQIENLSLKEVPERLAGYLLCASEEQGDNRITLTISKGQLASLLGTTPETLSRIFAKMGEEGLINVDGKVITIEDRDRLEEKR